MSEKIPTSVKRFVRRKLLLPFEEFIAREASSGVCLLVATVAALLWANLSPTYHDFWQFPIGLTWLHGHAKADLHFVVNDVLMAVFFFVVGMEIKRELLVGELAEPRQAILPAVAATGGALVPAVIYAALNFSGAGLSGWGVPMATDIAFAVGIMALLGDRVSLGVKVFLTALAIADDLMAVLVIALFYTSQIAWPFFVGALLCLVLLVIVNRLGIRSIPVYAVLGIVLWDLTLRSGVHSTVAGVALALAIPARRENDLLYRLEHHLHPWVTFFIMPLFALANAGLILKVNVFASLQSSVVLGIWFGLLVGKPLGITLASWIVVKLGWASLPSQVRWRELHAASWLAGIGFTMSLFIAGLAFSQEDSLSLAKFGIFGGSLSAGIAGSLLFLQNSVAAKPAEQETE